MKVSSGETSEKWNTYLKTFFFILSKGLLRSLKVDIWYVTFTRQFFETFLQFFREITGNESEWFSNSLRFDHAILQRWEENCWRTSDCSSCSQSERERKKGRGGSERKKKRGVRRGEKSEKCRLARHRSLERSERRPVCVRVGENAT